MNENLNLINILKDAPKGTKLYSPLYGECTFLYITDRSSNNSYLIVCETVDDYGNKHTTQFTEYGNGRFISRYPNGECMLFPSKENRDWSTFKVLKKHKEFKPFERVLVREWCDCKSVWTASLYSHYDDSLDRHCLLGSEHVEDDRIIPYEGNENKLGNIIR